MSWFTKTWARNKKIDPLTHGLAEKVMVFDSKQVEKLGNFGAKNLPGKWGEWSQDLANEARNNQEDPASGIYHAALATGAVYGAGAAYGAYGGGAAAEGAGAAGAAEGAGGAAGGGAAGAAQTGAYTTAAADSAAASAQLGYTGAELGAINTGAATSGGVAGGAGGGTGAYTTAAADSQAASAELGYTGSEMGSIQTQPATPVNGTTRAPSKSTKWSDMARRFGSGFGGGGQQQQPLQQDRVVFNEDTGELEIVPSSKNLKTRSPSSQRSPRMDAISAGVSGADPISELGVQVAAIQQLEKQIAALEKRGR